MFEAPASRRSSTRRGKTAFGSKPSTLEVQHFRPESSNHHPPTSARLLYDARGIHGLFRVQDRYVRCLRTQYHDPVWKDSCVEFFAQPKAGRGYLNFEFNCGGAFLCCLYHRSRADGGGVQGVCQSAARTRANDPGPGSSLPPRVEPEITEPVVWTLRFFIPFALFEYYVGPLGSPAGQVWRGNFFKCAEENSHPHWGSWSPVDEFNFHRPNCFGTIRFA